jgi:hypothetical protein
MRRLFLFQQGKGCGSGSATFVSSMQSFLERILSSPLPIVVIVTADQQPHNKYYFDMNSP